MLVDKTNLYYKPDVLTAIKEVEEKEIGEKIFTREEVGEKLEKEKEAAPTEMSDVSVESGGYGAIFINEGWMFEYATAMKHARDFKRNKKIFFHEVEIAESL